MIGLGNCVGPALVAGAGMRARSVASDDPTQGNKLSNPSQAFAGGLSCTSTFASVINPPPTSSCQVSSSFG